MKKTPTFLQLLSHITNYIFFLAQRNGHLSFTIFFFFGGGWTSLSIFKISEKLCPITKVTFFWNSEDDNDDSNYTIYFIMLTLYFSVFFKENNGFDCLKNLQILCGWCWFWILMQLRSANKNYMWKLAGFLLRCSKLLLYQHI